VRTMMLCVAVGCASAPPPEPANPCEVSPPAPSPTPGDPASAYEQGQRVWIRFGERWYPGAVVSVLRTDVFEVAYDGYDADWNRVARPPDLRPYDQPPNRSDLATTPPSAMPAGGHPVDHVSQLHDGMHVLILWNEQWWPGVVLRLEGEEAWVRYDGYDQASDERVGPDRITVPR